MTAALTLLALDAASSTAKKSSSSSYTLFIFILVGAAFYFLFFRPQQRKAKALREQSKVFEVGDEVLTAGGLVGHVLDVDGDRVTLETSVGASFVVLKQYVVRKLEEPVPTSDEPDGPDEPDEMDELGTETTDHEPGLEPTEDGHDEGVTAEERPAGPAANGAGALGDSTADSPATDVPDVEAEDPSAAEGTGTPGRSRRSGRRKRRAPGGAAAGPTGPDGPPI